MSDEKFNTSFGTFQTIKQRLSQFFTDSNQVLIKDLQMDIFEKNLLGCKKHLGEKNPTVQDSSQNVT
jgi:hypothetical protein